MKLDFKRIMSSVLAFVMLFSSLVMVNVVSVSAKDDPDGTNYDQYVAYTVGSDGKSAKWDFADPDHQVTSNKSTSTNGVAEGIVFIDAASLKNDRTGVEITKGKKVAVPVPADSKGTIKVVGNSTSSSKYLYIVVGGAVQDGKGIIGMNNTDGITYNFGEKIF